jgi:hypothetical protein
MHGPMNVSLISCVGKLKCNIRMHLKELKCKDGSHIYLDEGSADWIE